MSSAPEVTVGRHFLPPSFTSDQFQGRSLSSRFSELTMPNLQRCSDPYTLGSLSRSFPS